MHSELAHFVAGRGHDAATAGTAYDDRLAPQGWIVTLFDGRVKSVHVDMQDRPTHGSPLGSSGRSSRTPPVRYLATVIVIFLDMTAGLWGTWFWSPSTSCSVCLPGGRSMEASVCPLPK